MPKICPFNALMYSDAGPWDTLCCPPYDVVSEREQLALESRGPYNAIRLERPLGGEPYKTAKTRLDAWLAQGVLRRDERAAYYMMEMDFSINEKRYTMRGFTARMELSPFSEGRVLPHEETMSRAKADRLALMEATGCNFSAIYGLYDDAGAAGEVLSAVSEAAPEIEFTMPDGTAHRLWRITDVGLQGRLTAALEDTPVFIADGHHRYETALEYRRRHGGDFVMATLVDINDPGLVVLPTHRVVTDCDAGVPERFLKGVQGVCGVEETELCEPPDGAVIMYHNGRSYLFTFDGGRSAAYCGLDVAMLHGLILEPYFGIDTLSAQNKLGFTRDAGEAVEMVDGGKGQCAFMLAATKISQIREFSLAGEKMPQKSTYFYPKLITGLGFNEI